MRIVHLLIGGEVAGGQVVALQLARAARAAGHEVSFVAPAAGPFTELAERDSFRVDLLDLNRTYRIGEALRLARLLRARRTDVLHTHAGIAANTLGRVAARLAGAAVVSHMHIENYFPASRPRAAVHRALDNLTARLSARIVAVSDDTRRALARQGYPALRMEVVHNGLDLNGLPHGRRPGLRSELGVPDEAPLVGEIARLCAVKGQRELIGAMAEVPDARLVLVGRDLEEGGAYLGELEEHAARLGVAERVVFAGYRDDAHEVLEELDVVALPSWTEGLPVVVLEALAHARPVVATPVGGTPELVIDGETGLLVPPRDPAALAAAIRRLLEDPALAQRLGAAGRALVEQRFSERQMTERVLAIYEEVTA
jgi:glycosyltransferase involved in cell wall biosynthesis